MANVILRFGTKRKLTSAELPAALEHIADSSDDDVFYSSDDVLHTHTHTYIHTHIYIYTRVYTHTQPTVPIQKLIADMVSQFQAHTHTHMHTY